MPVSYGEAAAHYARLATVYDRRWRRYTRRTLWEALAALPLSGRERILDVGCGTGEFARMAYERFPQLTLSGVDVTPAMVAAARQKLRHVPGASFAIATAEALPFPAERFDVVVCANMLHHVRSATPFLHECARVLRPHGRLLVIDWCRDFWHCRWFHAWLRLVDRSYVTMYRTAELIALIEPLGLTAEQANRFLAPPLYGMLRVIARKRGDAV